MKESIYEWMKNLAIFYIMLNAVGYLFPEKIYEKYFRFFMGIILIMMLCLPIASIIGKGHEFMQYFQLQLEQINENQELEEYKNIQKYYLVQEYIKESKGGKENDSSREDKP